MPIVLPKLPDPDLDETSPYCVIAKHRAKPGRADAYERRMLVDLEDTRPNQGPFSFIFTGTVLIAIASSSTKCGEI